MGVFLKSAFGLGVVYFAMFSPAFKDVDIAPTASLCGEAAQARIAGDASLAAQWAAAGCVVKVASQAQRIAKAAPPLAPPPPPPPVAKPSISNPSIPNPSISKPAAGTLTEADLNEPWFGPTRQTRKSPKRG